MKKKLNVLCAFVFLVLFLLIFKSGYDLGVGFYTGVRAVAENKSVVKEHKEQGKSLFALSEGDYRIVDIVPVKAMFQPDSVLNTKTGKKMPVVYTQMLAQTSPEYSTSSMVADCIFEAIGFISIIIALVYFVKLITSINRSEIFDWKNVKRLRMMGYALLVAFFSVTIPALINLFVVKQALGLENYVVSPALLDNIQDLFLALGCLIVAEIFAIGLKMREEQELTI